MVGQRDGLPLDIDEIITGERLQQIADITICSKEKISFHSSLPSCQFAIYNEGHAISLIDMERIRAAKIVFVYTDELPIFFDQVFPRLERPFVLITHNSDAVIDNKYLPYLASDMIVRWYSQNVSIIHPRLIALPIGIANAQWKHGDLLTLSRAMLKKKSLKKLFVYMNFSLHTNLEYRLSIFQSLSSRWFTRVHPGLHQEYEQLKRLHNDDYVDYQINYGDYLAEMSQYSFCLSPTGNGLDCHRTWEALYLGVTPVVELSMSGLLNELPCIALSDLSKLKFRDLIFRARLNFNPSNFNKLRLSYWRNSVRLSAKC